MIEQSARPQHCNTMSAVRQDLCIDPQAPTSNAHTQSLMSNLCFSRTVTKNGINIERIYFRST